MFYDFGGVEWGWKKKKRNKNTNLVILSILKSIPGTDSWLPGEVLWEKLKVV